MAGAPAGQETQARPRMLRVEVNGLLHDWFDIDEMAQFVRSPTFSTTLRENIARYFGVPVKNQAIYDEDGLLTTSADFSRALQRFSPKLYIYDAHAMGEQLREKTSEQLALIDAEVEQSRINFHLTNRPRTSATPRAQRSAATEKLDVGPSEGPQDFPPEVTPVKALPLEPVAAKAGDQAALLTTSASSVETTNLGSAAPGIEVPVERVVWASEPVVQNQTGVTAASAAVSRAPEVAPVAQELSHGPSFASLRAASQGRPRAADGPRVVRPSLSVRAPASCPMGTALPAAMSVTTPPHPPPMRCIPAASSREHSTQQQQQQQQQQRASLQVTATPVVRGRAVTGQQTGSLEVGHTLAHPMGRSVSPQPLPAVIRTRPTTPARLPSQTLPEQGSAWQSPGVPPPWHNPSGCSQPQQLQAARQVHAVSAAGPGAPHAPGAVLQALYSPVAAGAPGQVIQLPVHPQRFVQMQPQRPQVEAPPEGALCRDGSPTREFVESAGRFFGFVDNLQKRGCRKPRSGSEEGTKIMSRMQQAAQHGNFEGEVENIWE